MDVSIIIPVYKRTEWLELCLRNLEKQTYPGDIEILLVDDGSPNIEAIRRLIEGFIKRTPGHCIRFIEMNHGGPATARNFAVNQSKGSVVCFIDDDSMTDENWLKEIMGTFADNKDTALVSGAIYSYDREETLPLRLEKAVYHQKSWATCNIAYRRSAFEQLGGFDETFPEPSWEDNDLGIRARWAGLRWIYNPKAVVYHVHERSLKDFKRKCLQNGRGAHWFSRKYITRRPIWGVGTFFIMSRRLGYIVYPSVWRKDVNSVYYIRFLWSYYSAIGFMTALMRKRP